MKRTPLAILIEFIRHHTDEIYVEEALDALAAAAYEMPPSITPNELADHALNKLHHHFVTTGDDVGARFIIHIQDEDITA